MSIRFKLLLAMDAMLLLAVLMFGSLLYTSERSALKRQFAEEMDNAAESLSKVARESLLNANPSMLMGYTETLKRGEPFLELAYVAEGRTVIAHTDKRLAPRQLPLSSSEKLRGLSDKLLVKSSLPANPGKGLVFAVKKLRVNGHNYEAAVAYSRARMAAETRRALDASLAKISRTGTLVILAGTLVSLFLSGRLIRPVEKLVRAFARTGAGDLDYRLDETSRKDEIGTLYREFNSMAQGLKEVEELKRDFASAVTHELKSPLGAIESYLDLMLYDLSQCGRDPAAINDRLPRFRDNISFIKQNASRLLGFISDLLDAAKIQKGKFEIKGRKESLEPVIEGVVKLFSEKARNSGIALVYDRSAKKLPKVTLDPDRMSQVLANLVSNALKFTPKGGEVRIKAALVQAGGAAAALRLTVEDSGPGIPEAERPKLFGKFYQVPGSRAIASGPKGTGLGLYIVKSIVEAHGGSAFVAASPAGGASFGFDLPLQQNGNGRKRPADPAERA